MCAEPRPGDFPLAVLAKAPLPGHAKTRLIPALGAEAAARLHARLVRHTLANACKATPDTTLWTALQHDHPLFAALAAQHAIVLKPQPSGDLGQRIWAALDAMPGPGLVIGCDCPTLSAALLRRCQAALAESDVVCLPAEDGGYGLIGMRRADPRLFTGIDWGSARVMAQTAHRTATLGYRLACLETVWDLDRPEDLARLSASHPEFLVGLDDPSPDTD